jgi:hypothetical protein
MGLAAAHVPSERQDNITPSIGGLWATSRIEGSRNLAQLEKSSESFGMAGLGHLRRMDGAGAVSGLTPIATVCCGLRTYARGQGWG